MFELEGVKHKFYITSLLNLDSYVIIYIYCSSHVPNTLQIGMLLAHDGRSQVQLSAMLGWASKMVHQIWFKTLAKDVTLCWGENFDVLK